MRGIPLGVAVVAAALYLVRLGHAPFVDPPEGLHAEVTREMVQLGDWITPHVNGIRYFVNDRQEMRVYLWRCLYLFGILVYLIPNVRAVPPGCTEKKL